MNNRFKFRAWDKKHEIMVYGENDASREQIDKYESLYDWDEDYGCWEYKCLSGLDSLINSDNFIVEQCTGLKDKNGKLIYEGDIVREISKKEPELEEYITEVKWENVDLIFIAMKIMILKLSATFTKTQIY